MEHAKNEDFPIAFADWPIGKKWKFIVSGEELDYPPFEWHNDALLGLNCELNRERR